MPDTPISELTPEQAGVELDKLSADKAWAAKLLSGSGPERQMFDQLIERKTAKPADRVGAAIAGTLKPPPFETVSGGGLSTANLVTAVNWLKEDGLSDQTIRELHDGTPA